MIRADRRLLADPARLNSDVVPLAMQIMDDNATREEQQAFVSRLIELGTRLNHRAQRARSGISWRIGTLTLDGTERRTGAEIADQQIGQIG